ncbi:MAG: DUF4279 domain-containing protein [Gaiellaceae bacterium]
MKVRQQAYFVLASNDLLPHEITAEVGIEPDEMRERGSRSTQPLRPVDNTWKLMGADIEQELDVQIGVLIDRLEPVGDRIQSLVSDHDVSATLQIVRYLGDEAGIEESLETPLKRLRRLPGQHQLLGWHLDQRALNFLVAIRAELDVDEYG